MASENLAPLFEILNTPLVVTHWGRCMGVLGLEKEMWKVKGYWNLQMLVILLLQTLGSRRLITYEIQGKCRTVIDYFLIRKSDRKLIRDVKVIRQEECISGHKLIICVLDLKEGLNKHKMKFVKRCKV